MHVSNAAASVAVGIVSAIHFLFALAEIFLWNRVYPRLKQFSFAPGEAAKGPRKSAYATVSAAKLFLRRP